MKYGIDVSSYQGKPTWSKVKASGKDFAILRIAGSSKLDSSFEYNLAGCNAVGMSVGVYRYSYALSVAAAVKEAGEVVKILNGRKIDMGVWLDLEWDRQRALGKNAITKIANAWMKVITDAGYSCGIYCNKDWYRNVLDTKNISGKYWIAGYPSKDAGTVVTSLRPTFGQDGWQYSSKGKVPGIIGNVDMNEWSGPLCYSRSSESAAVANAVQVISVEKNPYAKPTFIKYSAFKTNQVQESVKWMQWELVKAGARLVVDGKFGKATLAALKTFQAKYPETYKPKKAPDGICGSITIKYLIAV